MRVRVFVAVIAAAVLLAACGSGTDTAADSKSGAHPKPSTTSMGDMPGMDHHAVDATTSVTDLNGHRVVGVKAQDVMAESAPDQPLDRPTHVLLAQQLVAARTLAMQTPTVADATAKGYHLVGGGFGPGSGAHYIGGYGGFGAGFDAGQPLALIYDGISPTSQMVGLMYYAMGDTAPDGFAGPNDHWHRHSGVCTGGGGDVLFPPDSSVTAAQCKSAGGFYMALTGWMVHAWVVPGWDSPDGVFSHENPDRQRASPARYQRNACSTSALRSSPTAEKW